MKAQCPHCHKDIELLEPKDLDRLGLTPNVRGPMVDEGALKPWAKLRSGKFFLFLRKDVDVVYEARKVKDFERDLEKRGLGGLSRAEQIKELQALERALRQMPERDRLESKVEA